MKTSRRRILLALLTMAPMTPGCGPGDGNQVIVKQRRGVPIRVDKQDAARAQAPIVDSRVPARPAASAGQVDVPIVEPE